MSRTWKAHGRTNAHMKCVFNLALMILLTTAVVIASAYAGYARATHMLLHSNAGPRTIVICGAGGQAETITLDRNGNPVDSPAEDCAHCADCSLVPIADLTVPLIGARPEGWAIMAFNLPGAAPAALHGIGPRSRGPPIQKVV